jgi:hypothetical protein
MEASDWWLHCDWVQCQLKPEPYMPDRASVEAVDSKAMDRVPASYIGSLLPLSVLCFCHTHQDVFVLDRNPGCQHLHGILKV